MLGIMLRITTIENDDVLILGGTGPFLRAKSFNYVLPGFHCEDKMVKSWYENGEAPLLFAAVQTHTLLISKLQTSP